MLHPHNYKKTLLNGYKSKLYFALLTTKKLTLQFSIRVDNSFKVFAGLGRVEVGTGELVSCALTSLSSCLIAHVALYCCSISSFNSRNDVCT